MSDRLSHLAAAFRDLPISVGGRVLRPITAGSLAILQESGNSLFTGESAEAASTADSLVGMFEFIWIHTAPVDQVVAAADDRRQLRREAVKLGLAIDLTELSALGEQLKQLQTRISAAMTEGDDEDSGKPMSPPTGSPPTSSTSAGTTTPLASTGFFGGSLLPGDSNTSTPPEDTTEAGADGPTMSEILPPNVTPLPCLPPPSNAG